MSRLMEIELEKLLNARFEKMIQISQRQFSSVHPHQCLKLVSGGTPFGYEALQTGVIRTIQTGTFALVFQYFDNDKGSFVEVMNNQSGFSHSITGTDACIILKSGAPNDNVKNHEWPEDIGLGIPDLGLKITDLKNLSKICKYLFTHRLYMQNKTDSTKSHRSYQDKWHPSKKNRGCRNLWQLWSYSFVGDWLEKLLFSSGPREMHVFSIF